LAIALIPGGGRASAAGAQAKSCFGTLKVVTPVVKLHAWMTIKGSHFTCKSPEGRIFPEATLLMYMPHQAYTPFLVAVNRKGAYTLKTWVPRTMISISSIAGGPKQEVVVAPGTYYFAIRLSDLTLPPVKQALGHIKLVQGP
jgi:hypothetical protein